MEKLGWERSFQLNFVGNKRFNLLTIAAVAGGAVLYAIFGDWTVLIVTVLLFAAVRLLSFIDGIGRHLCSCGRQMKTTERYCSWCGTKIPEETKNKRAE